MYFDLISDRRLQIDAICITEVSQPLVAMYQSGLKMQKDNQLAFAIQRAQAGEGSWWSTCGEILEKIHSSSLLLRMGLTQRLGEEAAEEEDHEWLAAEGQMLQTVYDFSVALASNVAWSQVMFRYSLPHAIAPLASRNRKVREDAMALLKKMVDALLAAKRPEHDGNTDLQKVLDALAWHRQPLAAEVVMSLRQTHFDPHSEETRRVAVELYAGSATTKDVLESTFGFLQDVSRRCSKNQKLSQHAVWMYAQSSKYATTGGVPHIRATKEDWNRFHPNLQPELAIQFARCMNAKNTRVPESHPADDADARGLPQNTHEVSKRKWRTSGPLSHQKSVAAMAYLMHGEPTNFQKVGLMWRGLTVKLQSLWALFFFVNMQPSALHSFVASHA